MTLLKSAGLLACLIACSGPNRAEPVTEPQPPVTVPIDPSATIGDAGGGSVPDPDEASSMDDDTSDVRRAPSPDVAQAPRDAGAGGGGGDAGTGGMRDAGAGGGMPDGGIGGGGMRDAGTGGTRIGADAGVTR